MPKCREALATVYHNRFEIRPLEPASQCTSISVAAHTLYEVTPDGVLDVSAATYEELTDGRMPRSRFQVPFISFSGHGSFAKGKLRCPAVNRPTVNYDDINTTLNGRMDKSLVEAVSQHSSWNQDIDVVRHLPELKVLSTVIKR